MPSEIQQKLDKFRESLIIQKRQNRKEFKLIASKCEHQQDHSGYHGLGTQTPVCKASGIKTLKTCNMDTCPAMY